MCFVLSRLEAIAIRLEAVAIWLGWRPLLSGWRPLLLGWRPSLWRRDLLQTCHLCGGPQQECTAGGTLSGAGSTWTYAALHDPRLAAVDMKNTVSMGKQNIGKPGKPFFGPTLRLEFSNWTPFSWRMFCCTLVSFFKLETWTWISGRFMKLLDACVL